jgi:hypothetical protein
MAATLTSFENYVENITSLMSLFNCFKLWLQGTGGEKKIFPFSNSKEFHWKNLSRIAHFHNQEALLFCLLEKKLLSPEGIPSDLIKQWEKVALTNLFINTQLLAHAFDLISKCEQAGIPVIPIKGFASIASVYKDIRARTITDLDILSNKSDIKAVSKIAAALGYQNCSFTNFYHLLFFHLEDEFQLEFHFQLYDTLFKRKIFLEFVWKRRAHIDIEDVRLPALSMEDQLVLDTAHILYHDYLVTLKHYFDFLGKLIIFKTRINWNYLSNMLALTGLKTNFLRLSLALSELSGIRLDIPWENEICQKAQHSLAEAILPKLASIGFVKHPLVGNRIKNQPGMLKKMAYATQRLFPPMKVMQATYNIDSTLETILFYSHHIHSQLNFFWKRKPR